MKILAFHYAFGNENTFQKLKIPFSDIYSFAYPGHGKKIIETPETDIRKIAKSLYLEVLSHTSKPYILMGYSMGGLVLSEVYMLLKKNKQRLPEKIILLAASSPEYFREKKDYETYQLEDIREELGKHGNTPQEILDSDEFVEFCAPFVKADLIALRDYQPEDLMLEVPVLYIRGEEEEENEENLRNWQKFIATKIEYHEVKGPHFFLFDEETKRTPIQLIEKFINNGQ